MNLFDRICELADNPELMAAESERIAQEMPLARTTLREYGQSWTDAGLEAIDQAEIESSGLNESGSVTRRNLHKETHP